MEPSAGSNSTSSSLVQEPFCYSTLNLFIFLIGLFIRKTAGGVIGGMVAAQLTNKIAKKII